jgi:hypothetical protein
MARMCIACGMPMMSAEDFAMADETRDYCRYCARLDGTMQSYEEKLDSMIRFVMKTQDVDRKTARDIARESLADLPAWQNRKV